ncbi:helix-turn-helix transcriptional regulator [Paenibacillus sp. LHD-117]|uniref:helix-turn-helix domain-containing protein n=1 Tax=Paenibacillus sp. LHD-117 TaxID=3071412 RepID=UPI0027DEF278|nr:helix-turn-helix transcriptional regulator [Paenibacillus sp. LHD-117]MDQ6417878.1 helix-turn-helix transcriptional regulator [Paenibacillus sp. LHD-117]
MAGLSDIGVKIAHLRKSRSFTQEELGRQVSVSAQALSKWENGDSVPDLSLVVRLADLFDCTTDYLLGREGGIESLLPQIREAAFNMTIEQKIRFLRDMILVVEAPIHSPQAEQNVHPSLVHIHLGPTGIGLWAKDRLVCIATTTFLEESIVTLGKEAEFPLNLLSDDIREVLLVLLRDIDDLKPDYAVDENTLRSLLPGINNFDLVLTECIELGFVDRVRGGYRLNYKADLAVRLLAIVHQSINKRGTMNVTVGGK